MSEWKPEGYTSVSPYLACAEPQRTIDFLVAVFGGKPLRRYDGNDGKLMHAEVQVDDSVIMVSCAWEEASGPGPHLHVYVPDVDDTYKKALAFGATSVQEPIRKDDEDKRGGVKDANDITWWLGTQGAR